MSDQPPAFQFYAREFLSSANVSTMTAEQVGIYIRLLCYAWLDGSIPDDLPTLATLARVPLATMRRAWPSVGRCWVPSETIQGRLVNPRMEKERAKQVEYREHCSNRGKAAAQARWNKQCQSNAPAYADAHAPAMLEINIASASSSAMKSPPNPPAERGGISSDPPGEAKAAKPTRGGVFARAIAKAGGTP